MRPFGYIAARFHEQQCVSYILSDEARTEPCRERLLYPEVVSRYQRLILLRPFHLSQGVISKGIFNARIVRGKASPRDQLEPAVRTVAVAVVLPSVVMELQWTGNDGDVST